MPKVIPNLEDKLIKQSIKIINEKGFESFHLPDVAKVCKIAIGSI